MCKRPCFVPPYSPRSLSVFEFIAFVLDFLCSFTEITVTVRKPVFVLELRQLFYGHLAIQLKKLPNCLKRPNDGAEQVVKKEVLRGQTKEWTAVCFDKLWEKCNHES